MRTNEYLLDKVQSQNDERLDMVKKMIANKEAALVLGAGISIPAGLPDWKRLIAKALALVLYYQIGLDKKSIYYDDVLDMETHSNIVSSLEQDLWNGKIAIGENTNILELGQYLIRRLQNENASDASYYGREVANLQMLDLIRQCIEPKKISINELKETALYACAQLLQPLNEKYGISDVVTYNYDNLLEGILSGMNKPYDSRAKNGNICNRDSGKIHIYHVHGCCCTKMYPNAGEDSDELVLAEENYYESERAEYRWSHLIQCSLLQEKNCIFLGFSAQDYNFRRLLKILQSDQNNLSKRNARTHYLFLPLEDIVNDINIPEDLCDRIKMKKSLVNFLLSLKNEYWSHYNIQPIWTTYEQLPQMLKSFAESSISD